MEALVTVGLVSNVLQFVDFTTKLLQTYNNLRHDSALPESEYHSALLSHIIPLSDKIRLSAESIAHSSGAIAPEQKALEAVANGCCEVGKKLLKRLETCGLRTGQNVGRVQRAKTSFKVIWKKREMDDMLKQLEQLKSELALHMTSDVWYGQLDSQATQATRNDVKAVSDKVMDKIVDLDLSLRTLRADLLNTVADHQNQALKSITSLKDDNSQFRTEMRQQAINSSDGVLQKVNSIQQILQTQHVETMDNFAQVRVENSRLYANMATQGANVSDSIYHVVRPLLEEYQERILDGIRKEFRGTARAEMESFQAALLQDLHNTDYLEPEIESSRFSEENQSENHATKAQQPDEFSDSLSTGDKETGFQPGLGPRKSEMSVVYRKDRSIQTRLGQFSLYITSTVHLRPGYPALKTYNLRAYFYPSLQWFSTGYSVVYQRTVDGRGPPKFGFQFPTYRIISDDHEVWETIAADDVGAIQDMLSQKVISPSDRDHDGMPLLHGAIICGNLDICKALIHSGADVNATDSFETNSIGMALLIACSRSNARYYDIFCYLQSIPGINMENVWLNEMHSAYSATLIMHGLRYRDAQSCITTVLPLWASICRAADVDLDIPGSRDFVSLVTWSWSSPDLCQLLLVAIEEMSANIFTHLQSQLRVLFNAIVDGGGGLEILKIKRQISVAYAACILESRVREMGFENRATYLKPTSARTVDYHGYYVEPRWACSFYFLEHVISTGIRQRPDSIFDEWDGWSVTLFMGALDLDIWFDILEDHDIDPSWVMEEDRRRGRVVVGHTSAHNVVARTDIADVAKVHRRKVFTTDGDH
ncbi:hypothetical protein F5Y19DRAFT_477695 [Xylariaceae sp. FL1651]|nr:hypothetical protein F5Y19DRAFT_477695 [Xylariaceae sp. FL1651]